MFDSYFSNFQNQFKAFADDCLKANRESWQLGAQYLESCTQRNETLITELVNESIETFKSSDLTAAGKKLVENGNAQIENLLDRCAQFNEENASAYMELAEQIQKLYQPLYQFDTKVEKPASRRKKRAA